MSLMSMYNNSGGDAILSAIRARDHGVVENWTLHSSIIPPKQPLGSTLLRSQKGRMSPPKPKRSKMIAVPPKKSKETVSRPKKTTNAVHGLPVGGSKNIKGSFWVNSKFEIIRHDCSGKNKFPEVHISNYCPTAKEVARRVSKRDNNKIIKIQYVCQCIRHEEVDPVSPAAQVEEEKIVEHAMREIEESDEEELVNEGSFEEYEYDGFNLKWNKYDKFLLDPDDGEVMGKMIAKDGEWVPEFSE